MMALTVFATDNPPLAVAVDALTRALERYPCRLAFAGRAGSGKTTMCELITGRSTLLPYADRKIPIINHADGIKEEVLEWVARAKTRGLIPEEEATLDDFCDFLGLSPAVVKTMLWELIGPLWEAMRQLLEDAYNHFPSLVGWTQYQTGENVEAKVAFVDEYKPYFRTALQRYGEVAKELLSNPLYWVDQTITRSIKHPTCLNGDTRYTEEADVLKGCGWTIVYLMIDDATQKARRPELTAEQLAHSSENGMSPEDCTLILDATQPLSQVVLNLAKALTPQGAS